jgi:hypothetical protein
LENNADLFRELKILTGTSLYIFEIVCFMKKIRFILPSTLMPMVMSYTSTLLLLLHLIYLSYLSNVYRACLFFANSELFYIDNTRVIYRKIRYLMVFQ